MKVNLEAASNAIRKKHREKSQQNFGTRGGPISEETHTWIIRSFSSDKDYAVTLHDNMEWSCSCPAFPRQERCKHIVKKREELIDELIFNME